MSTKRLVSPFLFFFLIISIYSCGVGPTESVLFEPDGVTQCDTKTNCIDFLEAGYLTLFQTIVSSYGVNMHLLSDQVTSTNNVRGFYTAAQEPREQINNNSFNGREATNYELFFNNFQQTTAIANEVLDNLAFFNETELTGIRAKAYFLRGISRGYLGLIYDKTPYYTDEGENYTLVSYSAMIDSSLADLDKVLLIASSTASGFSFDGLPGGSSQFDEGDLIEITSSFAARILAGKARTFDEATQTDWERVLEYINNGIGQDGANLDVFSLSTISSNGFFSNQLADWLNQIVEGNLETGAGYLPPDLKIIHLLDEDYPTEYPEEGISSGGLVLEPGMSDDPRLESYYNNTQNVGYFRFERNNALFSNYVNKRMHADNQWDQAGNDIIFFTNSESKYLKAEALIMLNRTNEAVLILNESPAGTGTTFLGFSLPAVRKEYISQNSFAGGYEFTGDESLAEMQLTLLREYSIELDFLGGIGLPWFFMRRHDLLQEGTPTMYPIPGIELELLELSNYSFGGEQRIGQPGTASGANSWKTLRDRISN